MNEILTLFNINVLYVSFDIEFWYFIFILSLVLSLLLYLCYTATRVVMIVNILNIIDAVNDEWEIPVGSHISVERPGTFQHLCHETILSLYIIIDIGKHAMKSVGTGVIGRIRGWWGSIWE